MAAITLGIRRPDLRAHFEAQSETIVEIVKLGIFVVFGSLLTVHGLLADGWSGLALAAVVLVLARPVAVLMALIGTATDLPTRAFMGWFGPKGVSSIAFVLLVVNEEIPAGPRIFDLVALTVLCSIILHGTSDTPGARWIARHSEHTRARRGGRRLAAEGAISQFRLGPRLPRRQPADQVGDVRDSRRAAAGWRRSPSGSRWRSGRRSAARAAASPCARAAARAAR